MSMVFANNSIQTVNSDQEEYFYHLEQASQFLEYALQAEEDVKQAMTHFNRHNAWLKEHSNETFMG
jgi:hypothetical protein